MTVVSFVDIVPVPRFDSTPWSTLMIDESDSSEGPWTLIDTQALSPVDSDPSDPMPRDITTTLATLDHGWYRLTFGDTLNNTYALAPILNAPGLEYECSVTDVAELILVRTRDNNGKILGTFNDTTVPTGDQVRALINNKALPDVMPLIGTDIPDELIPEAQNVVAIRTAMYIELTYYGNEVAQNRSVYSYLKTLFDEKVETLRNAVAAVEAGLDITDDVSGDAGYPFYDYPPSDNILSRPA